MFNMQTSVSADRQKARPSRYSRPAGSPDGQEKNPTVVQRRPPLLDFLAFLTVLTTGVVLVAVAGVPVDGLASFAVGAAALYAAWTGHRR